jgi:uncharacterized membrane protein YgcG
MSTFKRAWRHLITTRAAGKRMFPPQTLTSIQSTIAAGEAMHRAEIRVIVEPSLNLSEVLSGMTSRERASELFTLYRIWDTEENCGVLIYMNLADHQVEIIADRGLTTRVSSDNWHYICTTMTRGFAKGNYHDSVLEGLTQLNALLKKNFPEGQSQQIDQLSNLPILL